MENLGAAQVVSSKQTGNSGSPKNPKSMRVEGVSLWQKHSLSLLTEHRTPALPNHRVTQGPNLTLGMHWAPLLGHHRQPAEAASGSVPCLLGGLDLVAHATTSPSQ